MSAVAVLSARYLFAKLKDHFIPTLPASGSTYSPHARIYFDHRQRLRSLAWKKVGISSFQCALSSIGKLFLDFGLHTPTVAFPEQYGLDG